MAGYAVPALTSEPIMLELAGALVPAYIFARMFDLFTREPAPHPATRAVALVTMFLAVVAAGLAISTASDLRAVMGQIIQP